MADERARISNADGNTRKRKVLITSESHSSESGWSVDSVFSPATKRYKLPTLPVCVFGGMSLTTNEMSSYGYSCNLRGPSTSSWGPAQISRLNFQKPYRCSSAYFPRVKEILAFLIDSKTGFDHRQFDHHRQLPGPDVVTAAMEEKVTEECRGDPVTEYIEELFVSLKKEGFSLETPYLLNYSGEQIAKIETYMDNKINEDQKSEKCLIRNEVLEHLNLCLKEGLELINNDEKEEVLLDDMIVLVMQLVQLQDKLLRHDFRIRNSNKAKVKFEICGSLVTSTTNILWEVVYKKKTMERLPIVMSENKGYSIEGERQSKQTATRRKAFHLKLPKVIGQCISMADKSFFETKDYKIVYHVSLMSTTKLVFTRTHVAKSTLKLIKDGCPIPDQNDLDPSYVFEAQIDICSNWKDLMLTLYNTLKIFGKLAYLIVAEKSGAEQC